MSPPQVDYYWQPYSKGVLFNACPYTDSAGWVGFQTVEEQVQNCSESFLGNTVRCIENVQLRRGLTTHWSGRIGDLGGDAKDICRRSI